MSIDITSRNASAPLGTVPRRWERLRTMRTSSPSLRQLTQPCGAVPHHWERVRASMSTRIEMMHVTARYCQLTLPRGTRPHGAEAFPEAGSCSASCGRVPSNAELFPKAASIYIALRTRSQRQCLFALRQCTFPWARA